MTRKMADSVDVANLPDGFDLYAAYVDGNYKNYVQAVARFGLNVVGIAVFSTTNMGTVGDCESGDMTPQTAVQWAVMRRAAGVDPTIYCSEALWPTVQQAFIDAGVPEPHWWIAGYPGSVGDALYPGSVAHQWIDRGPYDESVVADYWPGVDPTPQPQETGMAITADFAHGGQDHVIQASLGSLWHKWTPFTSAQNETLAGPQGGTAAGCANFVVTVAGNTPGVTAKPDGSVVVTFEGTDASAWRITQAAGASTWAGGKLP